MWRLAEDYPKSRIVYFNSVDESYYLLLSDGTSDSIVDRHHLNTLLTQPDTFLLFDAEGKEYPPIVNAPTIIVSSDDERQCRQWEKSYKFRRYMPAWTLDEIMLAYKHIPLYGLTEIDVRERFRIIGGVPRFVFDDTVRVKRIMSYVAGWIGVCHLQAILGASYGGFRGDITRDQTIVTANLINLVPNSPAYDELLRVEWMSPYIASTAVTHYYQRDQAQLVSFLRTASESDRLAPIFDDAFKAYAHLYLAQGGVFTVRPLSVLSSSQRIELQPTEVAWFRDANQLANFDDKVTAIASSLCNSFISSLLTSLLNCLFVHTMFDLIQLYGRPVTDSDTFTTLDKTSTSVIQPNKVFHITTSFTHDSKLAGMMKMIGGLKDTRLHRFFIVVPEIFFLNFTTIRMKPPTGERSRPMPMQIPKTVEPYVLALPLSKMH